MKEIIEEDEKSKKTDIPSLNSVIEMSSKNRSLISLTLFSINIISFIFGVYILYHNDYYLNPEYKFVNQISLYIFIIIYTLGMLSSLILSFLFASIMKIIIHYKNNNKKSMNFNNNNNSNLELIANEEVRSSVHTPISSFILNNKQNEIALIPFTLSYFIAFTIGIYLVALPYAFLLITYLFQNEFFCKVFSFLLLYLFMLINLCAGLINAVVLIYLVFVKKRGNIRKIEYNIDNKNIENIRNEIRNAMN